MGWKGGWGQQRSWVCLDPNCGAKGNFWFHKFCHKCGTPWYQKPAAKKGPEGQLQGSKWANPAEKVGNTGQTGGGKDPKGAKEVLSQVTELLKGLQLEGQEQVDQSMVDSIKAFQQTMVDHSITPEQPGLQELLAKKKKAEADQADLQKRYGDSIPGIREHIQELEEQIQQLRIKDPHKRFTSVKDKFDNQQQKVDRSKKKKEDLEKELKEAQQSLEQEEEGLGTLRTEMEEAKRALGVFAKEEPSTEAAVGAKAPQPPGPEGGGTQPPIPSPMDEDRISGDKEPSSKEEPPRKPERSRSPKRDL